MDTETGRHRFHKIILPAALILSAVFLLCAARRLDGFAQWYSVTIYPLIVGSVGRLFGLLPFSLSEILCAVLPLLIIADAVRLMIHASRRGEKKLTAVKILLQHIFLIASLLLFQVGREVHFMGDQCRLLCALAPSAKFPRRGNGLALHAKRRDGTCHKPDQPSWRHLFSGEVTRDQKRVTLNTIHVARRIHPLCHKAPF